MLRAGPRYVILGAGGVGCALGGRLQRGGARVLFVARGAQYEALRGHGLILETPSSWERLTVSVVESREGFASEPDDIVLLCTKSQDTAVALKTLLAHAPQATRVICAQNGVANERLAASLFDHVYGMLVFSPIGFLEPGRVTIYSEPALGGLDLGAYPEGLDELTARVTADLRAAGFDAREEPSIRRLKYGKLLGNLGNGLQALGGKAALIPALLDPIRGEALTCLRAANIDFAPMEEVFARNANISDLPVNGRHRPGGSTFQSLARRTGTIEAEALNGEIVALGSRFGVATPKNRALLSLMTRAAEERWPPEHFSADELRERLREADAAASSAA